MEHRHFAVVKKDNYNTTHSTGEVVVSVNYWPTNVSDRSTSIFDIVAKWGPGHELIPCDEGVQVGWIYTDKTHLFVDSNVSDN